MFDLYTKLLFIDLETTGPNPAADRITEIGIVEVTASSVTRWSTLVNPEAPIPPFIQNLTGITDAMVKDAPPFASLAQALLARLQGGLFIAHNARFDYGFLRNAFKQLDYSLRCEVLCTVKLSRRLFPAEPRHNLDALVARHGLSANGRHRALADADLLWQFWRKLTASVPAQAMGDAVRDLLQRPGIPEHLSPELLDDIPDTPGVYLFYGEHEVPVYVGKASHLRQRILSHFGQSHASYKDRQLSLQVRRLDWHETAGDIGAQLLEDQLIRKLQPVHNLAARHGHEVFSWQLRMSTAGHLQPVLVSAREQDFGSAPRLYGLFNSRRKAENTLRALVQNHGLCPAVLGLDLESGEHQCHGTCDGREPAERHQQRLLDAFASIKVNSWPYNGPVCLLETNEGGRQDMHVVNNWRYLGTARDEQEVCQLLGDAPADPAFDMDTYKILSRAIALGKIQVCRLTGTHTHPPACIMHR